MKYPLTIAVDFDGTICEYAFPECGPPRAEVIEALRMLHEQGWKIIVHSSRVNSQWPEPGRTEKCEVMVQYLLAHAVCFDEIWGMAFERISTTEGTQGCMWGFEPHQVGKPVAHVYLDDRAIRPQPVFCPGTYAPETLVRLAHATAKVANDDQKEA